MTGAKLILFVRYVVVTISKGSPLPQVRVFSPVCLLSHVCFSCCYESEVNILIESFHNFGLVVVKFVIV